MALPLLTTLIPLAVNGIRAIDQAGKNKGLKKDFQDAERNINPIDPNMVAFRDRLAQQEKYQRAGTDASSAFAMQNQQNALAQTQQNLVRSGASNPSQLLRAQQNANMGMAQVGAMAAQQANSLLPMQGQITKAIADRTYERQQEKRDMAFAEYQRGRQDMNNMISGITSTLPDIGLSFLKGMPKGGGAAAQGLGPQVKGLPNAGTAHHWMGAQPPAYAMPQQNFNAYNVGVDPSIQGLQV